MDTVTVRFRCPDCATLFERVRVVGAVRQYFSHTCRICRATCTVCFNLDPQTLVETTTYQRTGTAAVRIPQCQPPKGK